MLKFAKKNEFCIRDKGSLYAGSLSFVLNVYERNLQSSAKVVTG